MKIRSFRELWDRDGFDKIWMSFSISFIILLILWYLTGIAHELGHGIVCWVTGGTFPWDWVFLHMAVLCDPFPEQVKEISWAMGGSFGVVASIMPIFVFKILRRWNFILNAFLGCGFMQLGYAIFESTQNELYRMHELTIGNASPAILGVISIIFFTLYIEKIRKYATRKKSIK